jgi:8-oxo-dGTP pyrophosphatase MutT (NUDIX family)
LQNKFEGCGEFWSKCEWTSGDTGENKKSKFDAARYWRHENAYYSKKLPIEISDYTPDIFKAVNDEMYYEELGFRVLECVDSLIFAKDEKNELRFLMIRRKKEGECWEYPKGGLFYHETVLESAYREIEEETGIEIDNLISCGNLGWQTVNVEERKDYYDTLRVHGVTFYYTGNLSEIKIDPKHDKYTWVSLHDARDMVWMKNYGPEFFNRWERNKKEILQKIAGKDKKEEIK